MAQWCAVQLQLLPPLGHPGGAWHGRVRTLLSHQVMCDPGRSLSVVYYGIRTLLIIHEFRTAHPHITQPWYAYYAGAGGTFAALQTHIWDLMMRESPWGYLPDTTKRILVVSQRNVLRTKAYFKGMGVSVVIGSRYLGIFIGDPAAEKACIKDKSRGWMELVEVMAGVASQHPQKAYADLKKSLQQEWDFV